MAESRRDVAWSTLLDDILEDRPWFGAASDPGFQSQSMTALVNGIDSAETPGLFTTLDASSGERVRISPSPSDLLAPLPGSSGLPTWIKWVGDAMCSAPRSLVAIVAAGLGAASAAFLLRAWARVSKWEHTYVETRTVSSGPAEETPQGTAGESGGEEDVAFLARAIQRAMLRVKAANDAQSEDRVVSSEKAATLVDALEGMLAGAGLPREAAAAAAYFGVTNPRVTAARGVADASGEATPAPPERLMVELEANATLQIRAGEVERAHAALSERYVHSRLLVDSLAAALRASLHHGERALADAMRTLRGALTELTPEGARRAAELAAVVRGEAEMGGARAVRLPNTPARQFAASLRKLRTRVSDAATGRGDRAVAPGATWREISVERVLAEPGAPARVLHELSLLAAAYDNLTEVERGSADAMEVTANAATLVALAVEAQRHLRAGAAGRVALLRRAAAAPPRDDAARPDGLHETAQEALRSARELPALAALREAGVLSTGTVSDDRGAVVV